MKTALLMLFLLISFPAWSSPADGDNVKNAWSQLGSAARAIGEAAENAEDKLPATAHVLINVFDGDNKLTQSTNAEVVIAPENTPPQALGFEINTPNTKDEYEIIDLSISFWDVSKSSPTGKMDIELARTSANTFTHKGHSVLLPQNNHLKTSVVLKEGFQQAVLDEYRIETTVRIDR